MNNIFEHISGYKNSKRKKKHNTNIPKLTIYQKRKISRAIEVHNCRGMEKKFLLYRLTRKTEGSGLYHVTQLSPELASQKKIIKNTLQLLLENRYKR